jgi:guanylate kinase
MKGKLIIFSAPSGAGKSTIVRHLMSQERGLFFSISATSRQPREGEKDGHEYHFISPEEFRDLIEKKAFIEWEEVYPGQYYGTLHSELDRIWEQGGHAVFDIDVMGGLNLKKEFGDRACAIFILPPSLQTLEERLRSRGSDDEASLHLRLDKASSEMQFAPQFDHIVVNDRLEDAQNEALNLVRDFLAP